MKNEKWQQAKGERQKEKGRSDKLTIKALRHIKQSS